MLYWDWDRGEEEEEELYQEVLRLGQGFQDLVGDSVRQAGGHVQLHLTDPHTHTHTGHKVTPGVL